MVGDRAAGIMMDHGFILLIAAVAFAYAMVGHGGASGYLAVMAVMGFAPAAMKPSALVLNLCVSAIAFAQFSRAGHFRWKLFWPFALASIPCAYIGGGIELETTAYMRLLALCLVIAALRLFGLFGAAASPVRSPALTLALVIGGAIGLLSGLLGIGGGVLLSPVLLLFAWADAKQAAAVSALFIFVNSAAGLLGAPDITQVMTSELMIWTGAAVLGGSLGGWIGARKAPEPRLRQALAMVLLLASVKLFWP